MNVKTGFLKIRFEIFVCVFIIVTLFSAYWSVWSYDFINLDDSVYVSENSKIRTGLTRENIYWALTNTYWTWQPLTWISHMLDCELFGVDPGMHHLVNLLFHIMNSLLLFLVFKKNTGMKWESAFIALLFALHPLNVDSVAWISQRKNVLSTLWWILGIWAYSRFAEKPDLYRYILALVFFIFGLMTKPMCVTMPFVFLLLDYWPLNKYWLKNELFRGSEDKSIFVTLKDIGIFHRILEKVPFFGIILFYFYFFFITLKEMGTAPKEIVPVMLRISNAFISYILYIGKVFWPQNLAIYYPYPKSIPLWQSAGSALLIVLMTTMAIRFMRKAPYLMVGWFWYLGTLVPVIGLIQFGLWPQIADRWMYIPQIGIFMMVTFGISKVISESYIKKRLVTFVIPILLIAMTITTWLQVKHWKNGITIFEHTMKVTQKNMAVHLNMAGALHGMGRNKEAIQHLRMALKYNPDNSTVNYHMGRLLYLEGEMEEANTRFLNVLKVNPNDLYAHIYLGVIMHGLGENSKAMNYYQKALRIAPKSPEVFVAMGSQYEKQNNFTVAAKCYRAAIRLNPKLEAGYFKLGILQYKTNQIEEGKYNLKRAVQINPGNANARKYLEKINELEKNK